MLRGHVDLVTHQLITGWAADDAQPDSPVDVSIFCNGRKIAQVTCDVLRSDLQNQEGFGDGRHAFSFKPPPELPSGAPTRITVRHTSTGDILGNGDIVLELHADPPPTDLGARPPEVFFRLPAPEMPREMFKLLALHDPAEGLYNLLLQTDWSGLTPGQIAYAVFGSPIPDAATPIIEQAEVTGPWTPVAARDLTNNLLQSSVFQHEILRIFLQAFPEKRRLLFVHVPKCAGSDLSTHLVTRFPSLHEALRAPHWYPNDKFFTGLSHCVRQLPYSDEIFIRGHIEFREYLVLGIVRPYDRIFTILRDPIELAMSQINYILMRLQEDAQRATLLPDTTEWLELSGIRLELSDLTDDALRQVGRTILRDRAIVRPNTLCAWLGGGKLTDVLQRLADYNVEVTNTQAYSRWLHERWGINAGTRRNEFDQILHTRHTARRRPVLPAINFRRRY